MLQKVQKIKIHTGCHLPFSQETFLHISIPYSSTWISYSKREPIHVYGNQSFIVFSHCSFGKTPFLDLCLSWPSWCAVTAVEKY